MLITMFSMAGVPPTIGFYAKFTVLQSALQAGYIWAVVFAVLMAVVGAFYYLRIVKLMYFDEPKDFATISAPMDMKVILSINAFALLALGLMPQSLLNVCGNAIARSLQ
jgi:NADH-quinone oxidoreductase subunit N